MEKVLKPKILYEGVEATGMGTMREQILKEYGIDIEDKNIMKHYEVLWVGAQDDDGISESIYTKFKLVEKLPNFEPDPHILPIPPKGPEEAENREQSIYSFEENDEVTKRIYEIFKSRHKYDYNFKEN